MHILINEEINFAQVENKVCLPRLGNSVNRRVHKLALFLLYICSNKVSTF